MSKKTKTDTNTKAAGRTYSRVVALLRKQPRLLEAETCARLKCSRTDVRRARKELGIDRGTARAHVLKLLKKKPLAPAADMIAEARARFGVKFDQPDISRMRKVVNG